MLLRFPNTQIFIEIPDRNFQDVILKRKVQIQSIDIELAAQQVSLNLLIKYYGKDENEGYGDELNLPGINPYNKSLVADMTTFVDAATGMLLCNATQENIPDPENPNQTISNPVLQEKSYMYEFEFFCAMMHQPTVVADVATAKIQYAASLGQLD